MFVGIISLPNGNPFDRRYMQLANISMPERTIAAGPPYMMNVRKISASAKLIANFERGRESVILGATKIENTRMKRKPGVKTSCGRAKADTARQAAPAPITVSFASPAIFSLDIAEAILGTREFI